MDLKEIGNSTRNWIDLAQDIQMPLYPMPVMTNTFPNATRGKQFSS